MTHLMTVLVLQIAAIVVASRLFGFLFSRYLKQTKVLGELVAGMIIGPYALGKIPLEFLHGPLFPLDLAHTIPVSPELYGFATVASIVLLFLSGLETDLPTFLRFSAKGSLVGLGGVVISFFMGDAAAVLFLDGVTGFMDPTALFLGTLSTATSVGITARILSEKRKLSSPEGVTILAAAVLDDVIGIVMLAVVVGIARMEQVGGSVPWGSVGVIALKAFGFWIISTVLGILVAPKLTKGMKRFQSMDIVAGLSFGLALLLAGIAEMVGLAMIIGAYVIGLALSQTDVAHEIQEKLEGVYDFLVPIFFCVMGMMVDFSALRAVLGFGLIYSFVAILGKILGCGLPAILAGFNLRGAFRIGAGMLPRGEVTLIVAGIGLTTGAIGPDLFGVAIMTMLVASVTAPPAIVQAFKGGSGYKKKLADRETGPTRSLELEFPSARMAAFLCDEVLQSFRSEEFFVQHMDRNRQSYHLRKDNITIILLQEGNKVILNTPPEHEAFVRLLVVEEMLEFKDFISGLESMKSPDRMGAELIKGMFNS